MTYRRKQALLIRYLAAGLSNKEIGAIFKCSHHTIEKDLYTLYAAYECTSANPRVELVAKALRAQLIT